MKKKKENPFLFFSFSSNCCSWETENQGGMNRDESWDFRHAAKLKKKKKPTKYTYHCVVKSGQQKEKKVQFLQLKKSCEAAASQRFNMLTFTT